MKEEILKLRKLGYSYKRIEKELGCARSTISYHCKNNNLNIPNSHPQTLTNDMINKIKKESLNKTGVQIAKDLNLSKNVIYKYIRKKEIKIKQKIFCLNCNKEILNKRKFCTSKCSAEYKHKESYMKFYEGDGDYSNGYYSPKNFKDFFLEEQNNKCAICGIEPIWMNKILIFVLDHIDGDCSNNKRNNLRLICPNCDSQTNTFKSKTKHSKRRDYIKENLERKIKGEMAEHG